MLNRKTFFSRYWWEFLFAMTEREIKARYKHAVLGFLWMFIQPVAQMLVMGFIFQFFVPVRVDNYFIFLFTGLLPWNFFAYTSLKCVGSIVSERSLIQKAKFPREHIVLSLVMSNLLHLLVSVLLFLPLTMILNGLSWKLLLLPISIFLIFLFTLGIGLFLAAINVRYRDMGFISNLLVPLWFYATPVVYNLQILPVNFRLIFYINPMTFLIELLHFAVLSLPVYSWFYGILSLLEVFIVLGLGVFTFRKFSHTFDDWI